MTKTNPAMRNVIVGLPELRQRIAAHVAVNNAQIDGFPLILSVLGQTGVGKTFNIRRILKDLQVDTTELSCASLAHHREGMALYPIIRHYRDCGITSEKTKACLVIDDFDRSIASGYQMHGHTIHSQLLVGFLMDLCDNPYSLPDEETRVVTKSRRVPIVMTGNDFTRLDPALTRPQRMTVLRFEPSQDDLATMITSAFASGGVHGNSLTQRDIQELMGSFPRESIAFFSDIVSEHLIASCTTDATALLALPPPALRRILTDAMSSLTIKRALMIGEALQRGRRGY